jgi:endonuclease/exonuclease/phosphatase (EEP) superfamily protein YafD
MNTRQFWLIPLLLAACARATINYTDPLGPRYAGAPAASSAPASPTTIRVVTLNVEYAQAIDSAIGLLSSQPELRGADILLLQEMDEAGTRRIAEALGCYYVYYPATVHPVPRHDFGNAILSRWPLSDDRKIILPHWGWVRRTQRAAVTAVADIGGRRVQIYSLHMAMMTEASGAQRRAQARAVLEDADRVVGPVIIGGDLNSDDLGKVFARGGYQWPTRDEAPTRESWWRFDHLFFRDLVVDQPGGTGVVADSRGASDHRAVWAVAVLESAVSFKPTVTVVGR